MLLETLACRKRKNFPEGYPQIANVAILQGRHLAKNFIVMTNGKSLTPFHYYYKGYTAIIGKSNAVADLNMPKKSFTGWFAWVLWLFVHLFEINSYRNRVKTMRSWTSSYFTQGQLLGN